MISYKHSQDCFVASASNRTSATTTRAASPRREPRFIRADRQAGSAEARAPRTKRLAQGWVRAFLREGL